MFKQRLGIDTRGTQKKARAFSFIFLIIFSIGALLAGCSLPSEPTPGVALFHPADGVFLPFAAYTLDAEAIGGQFVSLNFIANDVTVGTVLVDPASAGVIAHYTRTPSVPGEYYLAVDGIGGPGGANRYLSQRRHVCVTRSVTAVTPGYTGSGCDPMPPTPGFTRLLAAPDPVYYDAPVGSPTCPGDLTVAVDLNDIAYIMQVEIHFDFFNGSATSPFASWETVIPYKADRTYADDYVLASFTSVDFSSLHGGDGHLSFYAFAFDFGSVRVALSDHQTVQLRHCVAGTPTAEPTMGVTLKSIFTTTRTPRPPAPLPTYTLTSPPPLSCADFTNIQDKCELSGCYYWSDGTCSSNPQPTVSPACSSYRDKKSCQAVGYCKWDGKSCY
jgi:hypothetical protein